MNLSLYCIYSILTIMTSRLYISQKGEDSRESLLLKTWNGLGLNGKVSGVAIVESYLVDSSLSEEQIIQSAQILTNSIFEDFSVNKLPVRLSSKKSKGKDYSFVIEVGYLPGVTDNVASTAKESVIDLLHLGKDFKLDIYTSKVYLISGTLKIEDVKKIIQSLYNPLIERGHIYSIKEIEKEN